MDNEQSNLITKLGLKPDQESYVLNPPDGYHELLSSVTFLNSIKFLPKKCIWIQAFYTRKQQLASDIDALKDSLLPNGQLWLSWPKKTSRLESNLDDNVVRQIGLSVGLVDVKVASVSKVWSGLKFVYRRSDR